MDGQGEQVPERNSLHAQTTLASHPAHHSRKARWVREGGQDKELPEPPLVTTRIFSDDLRRRGRRYDNPSVLFGQQRFIHAHVYPRKNPLWY